MPKFQVDHYSGLLVELDKKLDEASKLLLTTRRDFDASRPLQGDNSCQDNSPMVTAYKKKIETYLSLSQTAIADRDFVLAKRVLQTARDLKTGADRVITQTILEAGEVASQYLIASRQLDRRLEETSEDLMQEELESQGTIARFPGDQHRTRENDSRASNNDDLLSLYGKQIRRIISSAEQMAATGSLTSEDLVAMVRAQKAEVDDEMTPRMASAGNRLFNTYLELSNSMEYKINEAFSVSNYPEMRGEQKSQRGSNVRTLANRGALKFPLLTRLSLYAPKTVAAAITVPATFSRLEPFPTDEWLAGIYRNFRYLAAKYISGGKPAMGILTQSKKHSRIVAVFKNVAIYLQHIMDILPSLYGEAVSADIKKLIKNYYSMMRTVAENMRVKQEEKGEDKDNGEVKDQEKDQEKENDQDKSDSLPLMWWADLL
jgi:ribosomal protein L12E/L44/L45/RPP1/RPP2